MNYLKSEIVDKALNKVILTKVNKELECRMLNGKELLNQMELQCFMQDIAYSTLTNLEASN